MGSDRQTGDLGGGPSIRSANCLCSSTWAREEARPPPTAARGHMWPAGILPWDGRRTDARAEAETAEATVLCVKATPAAKIKVSAGDTDRQAEGRSPCRSASTPGPLGTSQPRGRIHSPFGRKLARDVSFPSHVLPSQTVSGLRRNTCPCDTLFFSLTNVNSRGETLSAAPTLPPAPSTGSRAQGVLGR